MATQSQKISIGTSTTQPASQHLPRDNAIISGKTPPTRFTKQNVPYHNVLLLTTPYFSERLDTQQMAPTIEKTYASH